MIINLNGAIKKRSFFSFILLWFVTFGLYGWYWVHKLAQDVNTMCEGDGKKTCGLLEFFLLGTITFGIYNLIWLSNLGNRLQENGRRYNIVIKEGGDTLLLWCVLGAFIIIGPFIALHILIKNVNALADVYNKRPNSTAGTEQTDYQWLFKEMFGPASKIKN